MADKTSLDFPSNAYIVESQSDRFEAVDREWIMCARNIDREFEVPARPRLVKVRIRTMGEKVSIIIPVYNAQNTIAKCIDSLLGSSVESIEPRRHIDP